MVHPVSLGAITTGLIVKAVARAEDDALDAGSGSLRRRLGFLRDRFSRDGDAPASAALARVEDAPTAVRGCGNWRAVITGLAQRDPAFRSELEELLADARKAGVAVGTVTQTAIGDQNVQIGGAVSSPVNVSYSTPRPAAPGGSNG